MRQVVELANSGNVPAGWRVAMQSVRELNENAYGFEVLRVDPAEGTLQPRTQTYIHVTWTPLEAKEYSCPIRVQMLRQDGGVGEELSFELTCTGYDPRYGIPPVMPAFPETLPLQCYAPVPGFGAALSIEQLDFGAIPVRARESRLVVLVNYSTEYTLNFLWDPKELLGEELTVAPASGTLGPGSHVLVVFEVQSSTPLSITGEVACHLEWTHVSAYQPFADGSPRHMGDPEEVLAYHRDYPHMPAVSRKDPYVMQHISVLHRLTVSRFRHLMCTPAGQKFLNDNLHRTALLSSHLPGVTPEAALTSTLGNSAMPPDSKERAPVPAAMPLHLRISVVVADWEVEEFEPHLIMPENVASEPVPPDRWDGGAPDKPEPMLSPLAEGTSVEVLSHLLKDVLGSEEMARRIALAQEQDVPAQFQFGVTPPPSPRVALGEAEHALYGPVGGPECTDEPRVAPPRLEVPVVERTEAQDARLKERQAARAAARGKEGPAPSLTSWGSLVDQGGAEGGDADPDASPMDDDDDDDEMLSPTAAMRRRTSSMLPTAHLLCPNQDAANFRVAVAQVLRQALATSIGDAIDGRSLGEHTWIE